MPFIQWIFGPWSSYSASLKKHTFKTSFKTFLALLVLAFFVWLGAFIWQLGANMAIGISSELPKADLSKFSSGQLEVIFKNCDEILDNKSSVNNGDIGIDRSDGSKVCLFNGSEVTHNGINILSTTTIQKKTNGPTAIQCGGSNGPADCNFTNVTVQGFGTGVYLTPSSTATLNGTNLNKNGTGIKVQAR